jgi:hypothetical protein
MHFIRSCFAVSATYDGFSGLQALDFFSEIFFRFTKSLLKASKQFVLFSFGKCEVVIGQLPVFLFEFAFHFVPMAFEL